MKPIPMTPADLQFLELRKRLNQMIVESILGPACTTTTFDEQKPLTMDDLTRAFEWLPKPDTWVSSATLAPAGQVLVIDAPDEKFYVVNQADVHQVVRIYDRTLTPDQRYSPLFELRIVQVDPYTGDSEETASWRAGIRKRVVDSIVGCLTATMQLAEVFSGR